MKDLITKHKVWIIVILIVITIIGIYHLLKKPIPPPITTTPEIESIKNQKEDLNQSIKNHYNDTLKPIGNRNDTLLKNINKKWND